MTSITMPLFARPRPPQPSRRPARSCWGRGLHALLLATALQVNAHAAPTPPPVIDSFVASAFAQPPAAETLWLTPDLKAKAKAAAGFAPDGARIRYWQRGERTAWVIDRVGKEAPITFGVIIENHAVAGLRVLTYRESRGYEIQSANWLAQFAGARSAAAGKQLDRRIDNISGATLSVRASRDVVRLALLLHATVRPGADVTVKP